MTRLDEQIAYYTKYCGYENLALVRGYLTAHPQTVMTKIGCRTAASDLRQLTGLSRDLVEDLILMWIDAGIVQAGDTPWGRCYGYARSVLKRERRRKTKSRGVPL
jgi:hypothetical protein